MATAYEGRLLHTTTSTSSSEVTSASGTNEAPTRQTRPSKSQKTQARAADALSGIQKEIRLLREGRREPDAEFDEAGQGGTRSKYSAVRGRQEAKQALIATLDLIDKRRDNAKDAAERELWESQREETLAELRGL
jgi:hypothetical protein